MIVAGDFNIDARQFQSAESVIRLGRKLLDICEQNGAVIQNCGPTFHYNNGSSELDYFLVRGLEGKFRSVNFGNSDHDSVRAEIPVETRREGNTKTIHSVPRSWKKGFKAWPRQMSSYTNGFSSSWGIQIIFPINSVQ